ncbi:SDR family oxidoreductase [Halopseudomonas sabulinigri]|uniref:SDR family oxidoreductase n=1 Tax=Halopseudomonas sabulinigri TaxID=472181 RepID=A0ABP9ZRP9_9GAMM
MSNQQQKVALVTGASRGIGAEIARRLAADGFAVAINYANSAAEANKLVSELRAAGAQAVAIQADMAQPEQVRALFTQCEQQLGALDVLVNNAGIMQTMPLADTTDELFAQTFAVNVQGVFACLREAATRLNEGGRIINLSTSALALKMPGYAIYNASKAAVEAMTQVFSKELRGRQITVNAVAPGPVETELFLNGKTVEMVQRLAHMAPLERLGQPEDIAAVVSFLASAEGGWINGQVLRANGGIA